MSDLSLFHFLRPVWLLFIPLAIIIPWLWQRARRPSGDWARVCDPHLLKWLSVGSATGRHRGLGAWIAGLALLIAFLALAGPSWVKLPDASFTARDARVIVMDLSSSMLAQDLKPDRLTQARFRLADLLEETTEGQIGVVAFAGDAFVVSPLTSDMNTIANLLPALRPDIIPVMGSRADRALEMGATLLERAGAGNGEILLVTDSADDRTAAAARKLRDEGTVVSVLAVGTPEGAPIPSGGGFMSDSAGNVVIARVDMAGLRTVADVGGGRFSVLSGAAGSLTPWADRDSDAFERRDQGLEERWQDAGPWLVLLLLPILMVGFRRGLLFSFGLVIVPALMPQTAQAGWWEDLWARKDQQAYSALHQEQPELAAAIAQDPEIAGEGSYRSGDYESAARSWDGIESAPGHYNRGNALALQGDLEGAIAAYEEALQFEPDMHDAIYNKTVVEQMLRQQQQQDQEGEGESQEGEQQQQDQQQSQEQSEGEQEQGENQEGQEQEAESESEQQEGEAEQMQRELQEAWQEEDTQAMEQWLRRIPDDPGGLLRRKFRNEYLRRGEQEAEDETW